MVEPQPSKLVVRVRFPSPAPLADERFPTSYGRIEPDSPFHRFPSFRSVSRSFAAWLRPGCGPAAARRPRVGSSLCTSLQFERRLRDRIEALGPGVRAILLAVLQLPEGRRAARISELYAEEGTRTFAELLIDLEEDDHVRGIVRTELGRSGCSGSCQSKRRNECSPDDQDVVSAKFNFRLPGVPRPSTSKVYVAERGAHRPSGAARITQSPAGLSGVRIPSLRLRRSVRCVLGTQTSTRTSRSHPVKAAGTGGRRSRARPVHPGP